MTHNEFVKLDAKVVDHIIREITVAQLLKFQDSLHKRPYERGVGLPFMTFEEFYDYVLKAFDLDSIETLIDIYDITDEGYCESGQMWKINAYEQSADVTYTRCGGDFERFQQELAKVLLDVQSVTHIETVFCGIVLRRQVSVKSKFLNNQSSTKVFIGHLYDMAFSKK